MNCETLEAKLMEAERQLDAGEKPIPFEEVQRHWRERLAEIQAEREQRTDAAERRPNEC